MDGRQGEPLFRNGQPFQDVLSTFVEHLAAPSAPGTGVVAVVRKAVPRDRARLARAPSFRRLVRVR